MNDILAIIESEDTLIRAFIWNRAKGHLKRKLDWMNHHGEIVADLQLSEVVTLIFTKAYQNNSRIELYDWYSEYRGRFNDTVVAQICDHPDYKGLKKWIKTGKYKESYKKREVSKKRAEKKKLSKRVEKFNCHQHSTIAKTIVMLKVNEALGPTFKIQNWGVYKSGGKASVNDLISSTDPELKWLLSISGTCPKIESDQTGLKLAKLIQKIDTNIWDSLATSSCEDSRRLYVAHSGEAGEAIGMLDDSTNVRLLAKNIQEKENG